MVYLIEYYSDKINKEYQPEYGIVNNIGELLNTLTGLNKLTLEYFEFEQYKDIPESIKHATQGDKVNIDGDFEYIFKHNIYGTVGFSLFSVSIEDLKLTPITNLKWINTNSVEEINPQDQELTEFIQPNPSEYPDVE